MVRQIGAMGDVRGKWAEEDGTKPRGEGGAVALRCRGRGSLAADGRALTGAGAKEDGVKPQGEGSAVPLRGRGRGFGTSDGGRAKPGRTSPNVGARAASYVRCRQGLRRRGRGRGATPERA